MSFEKVFIALLEGFGTTCAIFFLTLIIAIPLGLVISFGSMSKFKPLRYLTKGFIWVIRGTPLMLQIIIVFYVPGILFSINFSSRMLAVVFAFVINYACYFSEIYRGGIEAINKGQYEAGKVLGMTKSQIFFKVVVMQVVKRIVPSMSNEIITLVKDTSLARVITVVEIIKQAQEIVSIYGILWPLLFTGVFYLAFNGLLTLLFSYTEKKLNYYQG
ncbi:MAG TPA: amino acid ABC transporter permease [Clostridia bacterium]|nr:amino acid ABC transporter permease [Clostridia bacterium]